jgi:SAM-dependent methyltransferase
MSSRAAKRREDIFMPDLYSDVTNVHPDTLAAMINAMELRAADPRQKAIREEFLSKVTFRPAARVLEPGCGSGAVCRHVATWPNVGQMTGLDPSPVFLAKARELAGETPNRRGGRAGNAVRGREL